LNVTLSPLLNTMFNGDTETLPSGDTALK